MSQEDQADNQWRVVRACARCHRLKSKCVYKNALFCLRCLKRNLVCSRDEDPTAGVAKKRNVGILASRVTSKMEKSLSSLESDTELLQKADVDRPILDRIMSQVDRLRSVAAKLTVISKKKEPPNTAKAVENFHQSAPEPPSEPPEPSLPPYTSSDNSPSSGNLPQNTEVPIDFTKNIIHQVVHELLILSESQARNRFNYFLREMLPYYPVITFSVNMQNYDYIANHSPMILLACVYVTTFEGHGLCTEQERNTINSSLTTIVDGLSIQKVFRETKKYSYLLIYYCFILSLWSNPAQGANDFKSHMQMLCSANIALCIDAGNARFFPKSLFSLTILLKEMTLDVFWVFTYASATWVFHYLDSTLFHGQKGKSL